MAEGIDNHALDLKEGREVLNEREDGVVSGQIHDLIVLHHRPTEKNVPGESKQLGKDSVKDDVSATASDQMACSRWLWNVVDVITSRVGIMYVFLSAFCLSLNGLLLKMVSKRLHAFQIVVLWMIVVVIGSSLGIIITRASIPKRKIDYIWLLLNGTGMSVALTAYALSVGYLDVADAIAVCYSSLIFVCVLGWIFLKEPLRIFDFVFSFVALSGVVFIARPHPLFGQMEHSNPKYLIGIGFALGSGAGTALRTISFRKQTELEINKFVSTFSLGFVVALSNAVVCTVVNQWRLPTLLEWVYTTASGTCLFFSQLFLVMSLKQESPTMVSIILTFEIVFAFLWQFLFLDVSPAWTSYVGSLLLIIASVGITASKNRKRESTSLDQVNGAEREDAMNESVEIS